MSYRGGIWIATIHTQTASNSGQETSSTARDFREAFYIVDDPTNGLTIRNCEADVEGLVAGSNSLAFKLYENSFELNIESNTYLSGSAESVYGATGNITMIKVMAAPNPLTDLTLGTLRYSYNGGSEVTVNIQCYYEEHQVSRYQSTSESYAHFVSIYKIEDFLQNFVSLKTDYYDDENYVYRLIALDQNGFLDEFQNDSSNEHTEFSIGGTDEIDVSFEATDDRHFVNGSTMPVTLTGSATLNF